MSTKTVFWDVSQLNQQEKKVLDVAKTRVHVSKIQDDVGGCLPQYQQIIATWKKENKLTNELELPTHLIPYDFSEIEVIGEVHYGTTAIIKELFAKFQYSQVFQQEVWEPMIPILLNQYVLYTHGLEKASKGNLLLTNGSLEMMDSLIGEIRNDNLNRSHRKGVMQFHPRCDFFLWLMKEMKILEVEFSHFNQHNYYWVNEDIMAGREQVEYPT